VVFGLATMLRPGQVHEGLADGVGGLTYTTAWVRADLVTEVFGGALRPVVDGLLQPAVLVRRLLDAARVDADEERSERTLDALSLMFAPTDPPPGCRPEGSGAAIAAKRLLDDDYVQPVRVGAIASRLGVAPASLVRAFRRHTGLSPYAYVVSRRVDLARHLLDAGLTPALAAQQAGFYDQAHLTRHFRRRVGVPPAAYRRG
jgi:AraC-like DNA-binding protein